MDRFAKAGKTLNTLLLFIVVFLSISSLIGCGGYSDIPEASVLSSGRLTLSWENVPGAASYDLYISTTPGVTTLNSYRISDVSPPLTLTDLEPGTTYYLIVSVYSDSGESRNSKEVSYTVTETEGALDIGDLLVPDDPADQSPPAAIAPALSPAQEQSAMPPAEPQARNKSASKIIICFGDSLTSGTGATAGMDYPSQLARMIGRPVINKGVPGDTTSSALRRLNRDVLSAKPDIVLITLGGNDLKNGVSKNVAFENLKNIVESIQKRKSGVIIGGLTFPGIDRGFGKGYEDLARQTGAVLVPNIFAGIINNPSLMSDPIHPNNAGYRMIAQRYSKALGPVLKTNQSARNKQAPAATKKRTPAAAKKSTPVAIPKTAAPAAKKTGQAEPDGAADRNAVTVAWDNVPGATSYNIYWSDKPGVSRRNGTKITNVKTPYKFRGLMEGKKYYFVVTAVNQSGESGESEEFSFTVGQ